MEENNKTYRIHTTPGEDKNISILIKQDYDAFEILSLKLNQSKDYKLHSANYGILVGRVLANGGFGVPNAKISIFVPATDEYMTDPILSEFYSYGSVADKGSDERRYNLLPNSKVNECHQAVGSLPTKSLMLDNGILMDVFENYFVLSTRTNNSGDYMISGIPVGQYTLHMDLDLSDCGPLSQRPRDFVYKGYNIEQFENANQFKEGTDLETLTQIISQNKVVNIIPFWGNLEDGEEIGISRSDIEVNFKFEPTCVFIGSVVGDSASNGFSEKCIPTNEMGAMDELTTGQGTIEMIRKKPDNSVEEFQIKGTQLINSNGVWCYQIPMNLDYMVSDEYGNLVPTDDPTKGIPTRARVRFRFSMQEFEQNTNNYHRAKILVPHNPGLSPLCEKGEEPEDIDYNFGSLTDEKSFRDLLWDNVYSVKSYIPRIQKANLSVNKWKTERFSGIKHCNNHGGNSPMPYNNIRIKIPFMFSFMCMVIKILIFLSGIWNRVIYIYCKFLYALGNLFGRGGKADIWGYIQTVSFAAMPGELCPDISNWCFAPKAKNFAKDGQINGKNNNKPFNLFSQTIKETFEVATDKNSSSEGSINDKQSIMYKNADDKPTKYCLTTNLDYYIACVEMNLAQEYKVINFDFYNDWVNGVLYFPRWRRKITKKRKFIFDKWVIPSKVKGCLNDPNVFDNTRYYTQQCALTYKRESDSKMYSSITTPNGCIKNSNGSLSKQRCHKNNGIKNFKVFKEGGIVNQTDTMYGQKVYYLKPCEYLDDGKNKKVNLFATDIILLGNLKEENMYGIPQAFKYLSGSSYKMPTNLALTNAEDEGYLYSGGENSYCIDENGAISGEDKYVSNGIRDNSRDQSFTATKHYYDKRGNEIKDFDSHDDPIPRTEAAGISWNYSGPEQGENDITQLYFPGGHFLGLTCGSVQTNIKSCINLNRICEEGAEMSQRHEGVRSISRSTEKSTLSEEKSNMPSINYFYLVPTGLISTEEISGLDFRNAFSTLNSNKLIVDNLDENTGFRKYSFNYISPSSFTGELRSKIHSKPSYNKNLGVDEVHDEKKDSTSNVLLSYDRNENAYTFIKSCENRSMDYYLFRLGITDPGKAYCRYLNSESSNSGEASLPQYENSFYFYFGAHEGATAIDEFKNQFFAVCSKPDESVKPPFIEITKGNLNPCTLTVDNVKIISDNVVFPITVEVNNLTDKNKSESFSGITENPLILSERYVFGVGEYEIRVTDIKKSEGKRRLSIVNDLYKLKNDYTFIDFKKKPNDTIKDDPEEMIKWGVTNEEACDVRLNEIGGYFLTDFKIEEKVTKDGISEEYKEVEILDNLNYVLVIVGSKYYMVCNRNSTEITEYDFNEDFRNNVIGDKKLVENFFACNKGKGISFIPIWDYSDTYDSYIGFRCYEETDGGIFNFVKVSTDISSGEGEYLFYQGNSLIDYSLFKNLKTNWPDTLLTWTKNSKASDLFNNADKISVGDLDDVVWTLKHYNFKQTGYPYVQFDSNAVIKSKQPNTEIFTGQPERETENGFELYSKEEIIDKVPTTIKVFSTLDDDVYLGYDVSQDYSCVPTHNLKDVKREMFGLGGYNNINETATELVKDINFTKPKAAKKEDNIKTIHAKIGSSSIDDNLIGKRLLAKTKKDVLFTPLIVEDTDGFILYNDNENVTLSYEDWTESLYSYMAQIPVIYFPMYAEGFIISTTPFEYTYNFDRESGKFYNVEKVYKDNLAYDIQVYNSIEYVETNGVEDPKSIYQEIRLGNKSFYYNEDYSIEEGEKEKWPVSDVRLNSGTRNVEKGNVCDIRYKDDNVEEGMSNINFTFTEQAPLHAVKNVENKYKSLTGAPNLNKIEISEESGLYSDIIFINTSYERNYILKGESSPKAKYYILRTDNKKFPCPYKENKKSYHFLFSTTVDESVQMINAYGDMGKITDATAVQRVAMPYMYKGNLYFYSICNRKNYAESEKGKKAVVSYYYENEEGYDSYITEEFVINDGLGILGEFIIGVSEYLSTLDGVEIQYEETCNSSDTNIFKTKDLGQKLLEAGAEEVDFEDINRCFNKKMYIVGLIDGGLRGNGSLINAYKIYHKGFPIGSVDRKAYFCFDETNSSPEKGNTEADKIITRYTVHTTTTRYYNDREYENYTNGAYDNLEIGDENALVQRVNGTNEYVLCELYSKEALPPLKDDDIFTEKNSSGVEELFIRNVRIKWQFKHSTDDVLFSDKSIPLTGEMVDITSPADGRNIMEEMGSIDVNLVEENGIKHHIITKN